MRFLLATALFVTLASCSTTREVEISDAELMKRYGAEIRTEDLKEHLYLLSSDVLEGRKTGEKGQKMATNYLTAYYEHLELQAPQDYPKYRQTIPKEYFRRTSRDDSDNVLPVFRSKDLHVERAKGVADNQIWTGHRRTVEKRFQLLRFTTAVPWQRARLALPVACTVVRAHTAFLGQPVLDAAPILCQIPNACVDHHGGLACADTAHVQAVRAYVYYLLHFTFLRVQL